MQEDVYLPAGPAAVPDRYAPEPALRELYLAHGAALLGYLVRLTDGDRHRAEDILQETLVRAWRHPDARGDAGGWSRPWLLAVARRIAIDQVRAARARPSEVGDERLAERPVAEDRFDRLIDRAEVRAALLTLPVRLREVLVEVYFRQRTVAETAAALGIPEGTVKSRTYHAMRALRQELLDRGFLGG